MNMQDNGTIRERGRAKDADPLQGGNSVKLEESAIKENVIRMTDYAAHGQNLSAVARKLLKEADDRAQFFDASLFADPAWYILLDLYVHASERRAVSVSSLCIAARVPVTTALRWVNNLTQRKIIERSPDPTDRRKAYIRLSADAHEQMTAYLNKIANVDPDQQPAQEPSRPLPRLPG